MLAGLYSAAIVVGIGYVLYQAGRDNPENHAVVAILLVATPPTIGCILAWLYFDRQRRP